MSDRSKIEWTDATWNPVRGCTRVSEGCRNCYAERMAARFSKPGQAFEGLATITPSGPRWTGQVRLVEDTLDSALYQPLRWQRPRRIFVNSMSDLFHEGLSEADIRRVFAVMRRAPQHRFQVLTKRAERLLHICGELDWANNVWMGVSVESQDYAYRAELLRQVPAAIRFLSVEPLLGPIERLPLKGIHWVIVGGESGPGARPMHPDWARSLRDQCQAAGVPFFFKQWGSWAPLRWDTPDSALTHHKRLHLFDGGERMTWVGHIPKHEHGRRLDGRTWDEFPRG